PSHAEPPANQLTASVTTGTWTTLARMPAAAATALASITSGTSGTTTTFANGATRLTRSNVARMTGSVVSCAARVSATGSGSQAGQRRSRPSMGAPNAIKPAVASKESWNPTSQSTLGATSIITRAASIRA